MCTVSWFSRGEEYQVFFNRDEQRTRDIARPPSIVRVQDTKVIMPRDTRAGGTWIATNQFGSTYALLNFYQGQQPSGQLTSRGNIISGLAASNSLLQIEVALKSLTLADYAPFSLLCFVLSEQASHSHLPKLSGAECLQSNLNVIMYRWSGRYLKISRPSSPIISSAVNYQYVLEQRIAEYEKRISARGSKKLTEKEFYQLHASHAPSKSAQSVCMHRADAKTVSFSHILVGKKIQFNYVNGPPCQLQRIHTVEIDRN